MESVKTQIEKISTIFASSHPHLHVALLDFYLFQVSPHFIKPDSPLYISFIHSYWHQTMVLGIAITKSDWRRVFMVYPLSFFVVTAGGHVNLWTMNNNSELLSTVALVLNILKNTLASHSEMSLTLSMADLVRFARIVLAILDIENDPLLITTSHSQKLKL